MMSSTSRVLEYCHRHGVVMPAATVATEYQDGRYFSRVSFFACSECMRERAATMMILSPSREPTGA